MNICIVEDDGLQQEGICAALESAFANVEVTNLQSESAFLATLPALRKKPPDLFIIDVMLTWVDPSVKRALTAVAERTDDHRRGGVRCVKALLEHESTSRIPILVYSVLDRAELEGDLAPMPSHVVYLRKTASDDLLPRFIRSLMAGVAEAPNADRSIVKRFVDGLEIKPGLGPVSVDLRKVLGE